MTRDEVITLCRYVGHACPHQRVEKYTPNIWADILADYPPPDPDRGIVPFTFAEGKAAVVAVARRQPFITPAEIIAEASRARRDQTDRQRSEQLLAPVRARLTAGTDPRPLRSTIRELITAAGWRPALPPGKSDA